MGDFESLRTEEEVADSVADALCRRGLSAGSQDTGGGICCVIVQCKNGGEIVWGTADVNWGASVYDENGNIRSSISTNCPSDMQDAEAIAEAIKGPSVDNGALI